MSSPSDTDVSRSRAPRSNMVMTPDKLPLSPRRPYVKQPPPGALFTLFPKLPTELRLKIWNLSMAPGMSTCIVPVLWSSTRRTLYSPRKPPVQLHVCIESRLEALKLYTLRFASSPEFAKTYFSYENDILLLNWASLGSAPGRLGRKISDEEVKSVRTMMINEEALLLHAREDMRELDRFEGVRDLAVLCDSENHQIGETFGSFDIEAFDASLDYDSDEDEDLEEAEREEQWDERRKHAWPDLVCLRDHGEGEMCSRHWWFEWWNQKARYLQKVKWTEAMAECLDLTQGIEERDGVEEGEEAMMMEMLRAYHEAMDSF